MYSLSNSNIYPDSSSHDMDSEPASRCTNRRASNHRLSHRSLSEVHKLLDEGRGRNDHPEPQIRGASKSNYIQSSHGADSKRSRSR